MHCSEIWGGNQATQKRFATPGLDVYVWSNPHEYKGSNPETTDSATAGGGDVYYVTSCASGRITRLLLADVSGHGQEASEFAIGLRELLRGNVNKIRQEEFIEAMNREFGVLSDENRFATAAVATFFEPRKSLTIGLAGHPYPLYFNCEKQAWIHLESKNLDGVKLGNLPLGVHQETNYSGRRLSLDIDDMFLLYSDAFSEATDEQGEVIGIDGLTGILNKQTEHTPEHLIPFLIEELKSINPDNLADDDATLILGHSQPNKVRMVDNLLAPIRLVQKPKDNTRIG